MRRVHILPVLVVAAVVACSWSAEWVVTNASEQPVRVRIHAPRVRGQSGTYCRWQGIDNDLPVVTRTSELDDWYDVSPGSAHASIDPVSCSVEFTLPVDHSAVIWESRGTTHPSTDDQIFGFPAAIELTGAIGAVRLSGPHLDELFKPRPHRRFVLTYGR